MKTSQEIQAIYPLPWRVVRMERPREIGNPVPYVYFHVESADRMLVTVCLAHEEWLANIIVAGSQAMLTKDALIANIRPWRGPSDNGPEAA